jgi:hypothetical protein
VHAIDSDVCTVDSKKLISEAGSSGLIEVAMEHASSRSDDSPGSTSILAVGITAVKGSISKITLNYTDLHRHR